MPSSSLASAYRLRSLSSNGSAPDCSSMSFTLSMSRSNRSRTVGYEMPYWRASPFRVPEANRKRFRLFEVTLDAQPPKRLAESAFARNELHHRQAVPAAG